MLKQNLRIKDHEKDKANRPARRGGAGTACGCVRRQDCAGHEEQYMFQTIKVCMKIQE